MTSKTIYLLLGLVFVVSIVAAVVPSVGDLTRAVTALPQRDPSLLRSFNFSETRLRTTAQSLFRRRHIRHMRSAKRRRIR